MSKKPKDKPPVYDATWARINDKLMLHEFQPNKFSIHSSITGLFCFMLDREMIEGINQALFLIDNSDLPLFAERKENA